MYNPNERIVIDYIKMVVRQHTGAGWVPGGTVLRDGQFCIAKFGEGGVYTVYIRRDGQTEKYEFILSGSRLYNPLLGNVSQVDTTFEKYLYAQIIKNRKRREIEEKLKQVEQGKRGADVFSDELSKFFD